MKSLQTPLLQEEISQRILKLGPSDPPHWGVMSANQMVCHLRAAYADALSGMPPLPDKLPIPAPLLKLISLRMPRPWPQNLPTLPDYRVDSPAMSVADFETDRAGLLHALGQFVQADQFAPVHPFFGKMNRGDWMRWGYLHADHHLRQFGH